MKTEIDEGFVPRVYRTSAYVWAVGVLAAWSMGGAYAAAGWTLGAALSVGLLRGLEFVVRRSFLPGAASPGGALAKFTLIKLPLVLVILGLAVWIGKSSFAFVGAFCLGVLLTQVVMVLKVVGMLINGHFGK